MEYPKTMKIPAIYNPAKGTIGCVLIQAALGGTSSVANLFDNKDWDVGLEKGQIKLKATPEEWLFLANLTREERAARFLQSQKQPE